MRTGFERVYTDEQREAMAIAKVDGGMTPREVVQAAGAGLLRLGSMKLDPFVINSPDTVKLYARKLRNRRLGNVATSLPVESRDAMAVMKRRLLVLADQEIAFLERQKRGEVDLERIRLAARAMREAAQIPDPKDPVPPAPGARQPDGSHAPGSLKKMKPIGALMEAARTSPEMGTAPLSEGRSNGSGPG